MQLYGQRSQGLSDPGDHTDDEEQQLSIILASPGFQKAPAVLNLFLYLWHHRGQSISEYAIATEALARKQDFDPKTDATVRVHISRLRQKLKEFYGAEGRNCALRISIPLGSHDLEVQYSPNSDPDPPGPTSPWHCLRTPAALAIVSCVTLAAFGFAQFLQNRQVQTAPERHAPLPPFWRLLCANGKPTGLYLPTPVFFEWNETNLKVRDPQVNDFSDFDKSAELQLYAKKWGPPRLLQNYTTASDTFAALKLVQFLQGNGVSVSFGGTSDLSLDSPDDRNIILIGTPGITSRHLKKLMEKTNFCFQNANGASVVNRNPRPGEASRFDEVLQSNVRRTVFGLITLVPGKTNGTRLLTLTGRFTSPLVSFLVSPASLRLLEEIWRKERSPQYLEALVRLEVDGNTLLKAWPVGLRTLGPAVSQEAVTYQ